MNDLSDLMQKLEDNDKKLSEALKQRKKALIEQYTKDTKDIYKENLKSTKISIMLNYLGTCLLIGALIFALTWSISEVQIRRLKTATTELKQVKQELKILTSWGIHEVQNEEGQMFLVLPGNLETIDWEGKIYITETE